MCARIDFEVVHRPNGNFAVHGVQEENHRRTAPAPAADSTVLPRQTHARRYFTVPLLGILTCVGISLFSTHAAAANQPPTVRFIEPAPNVGLISPASFTLSAAGADVDGTVTRLTFALNGSALGIANSNFATLPVRLLILGNYRFTVTATDNQGATATTNLDLVIKSAPSVTLGVPSANARLTNATSVISGTASDSRGISRVEYAVNDSSFRPALGTEQWLAPIEFDPGTNFVRVRVLDLYGNSSPTNTRTFFQVVPSPISLNVSGSGSLLRLTNGQILDLNRGYRVSAAPAPGFVFSNWTGSLSSPRRDLGFLMRSNFNLTAHFVPNPFTSASGTYHGLIVETNSPRYESSGDFVLQLSSAGRYSASLHLAGQHLRLTGSANLNGKATNVIDRPGRTPVVVTWTFDLHGQDSVAGEVSDGVWQADLKGDRATFSSTGHATPLAGRYTLAIAPTAAPGAPSGDGWASVSILPNGTVTASGSLPDGSRFASSSPVSRNGDWPLYLPLYKKLGAFIGWIHFDFNAPFDDLRGTPVWFRPAQPGTTAFPDGFTNATVLTGSRYLSAIDPDDRVLQLTNGNVVLVGIGLSQSWTNPVTFGPRSVTNTGPNRLFVSVAPATGLFKGTFIDPILQKTVPFSGVLLQKSTNGAGHFLTPTAHGRAGIESVSQ